MKDIYKHIDDAYRAERGPRKPTPEQIALAKVLDDIGNWPAFGTLTFRPNPDEEVVWNQDGEHVRNKRVSWTEGDRIARTRPDRNGAIKMGTRRVAPGWSSFAAMGKVIKFLRASKDLRKGRWFACVEPHKFRDCYHAHFLFAGNVDANWEAIAADAEEKFGRFKFELVRQGQAMCDYLAKQYVGKQYGSEDFRMAFSRSCRRSVQDTTHPLEWDSRHRLFLNSFKDKGWGIDTHKNVKADCKKTKTDSLPSRGERGRELVLN